MPTTERTLRDIGSLHLLMIINSRGGYSAGTLGVPNCKKDSTKLFNL